jgi:AAA family ATP:ADP antiporter
MVPRIRRFFDIRRGELAPVAFSFTYVAFVVAAFLLAKPIRNGLFLQDYGPYALVYVYAVVPLVLSLVVPVAGRLAARIGQRAMLIASLWFFCGNVLLFWALFRFAEIWSLPAIFYVWVNCFGVMAPVQAWSFTSTLFDTRQAKRLFGLVGAGASFGGIAGGALGRTLIAPVGGTVNLLLVLAALIGTAAVIVTVAVRRLPRRVSPHAPANPSFRASLKTILSTRYLRLIASVVFLVAIATQWVGFQFSVQAAVRFGGNADRLTAFFSAFNFYMGLTALAMQLFLTGPVLRRFGMTYTLMLLPLALMSGNLLILLVPTFWPVLLTAGIDQGLRFSVDKASYELLYLPLANRRRGHLKAVIDIVVNRTADGVGAVVLGLATRGFFGVGGLGLGLRGTAAINVAILALWAFIAWRLRSEYVAAIGDSIRSHRLEAERAAAAAVERTAVAAISDLLSSPDATEVAYGLSALEAQHDVRSAPALRALLRHGETEFRRRALKLLNEAGDRRAAADVERLIHDADLETRVEALLYLSRHGRVDPLAAVADLDEFPEFSIRASMAAFLAAPGPAQNVEAARMILRAMIDDPGADARRVRHEAARLAELRPEAFRDEVPLFLGASEDDPEILRHAARAVGRLGEPHLAPALISHLSNEEAAESVIDGLARIGDEALPYIKVALQDARLSLDIRRQLPIVLARLATPAAEQLLADTLLQGDAALRYRIIASLNKLRQVHPGSALDSEVVELVLAAEITGHYRSYQVLRALGAPQGDAVEVLNGLKHAMEHELERIFRLLALLAPAIDFHSAYVALHAEDRTLRANAIEFLESSLKPEVSRLLLPLIDPHYSPAQRATLADGLVGAEIASVESAIETLLASDDSWLRETARAARERLWRPEGEALADERVEPAAMGAGL